MATLASIDFLVTQKPALYRRFLAGRLQAAWDVSNESAGTTNHADRIIWATKIFNDYEADGLKEFRRFHGSFGKDVYTCLQVESAVNAKKSPAGTAKDIVSKRIRDIQGKKND
jgi:argininosuccinate lyase